VKFRNLDPLNFDLLTIEDRITQVVSPVTSLDDFEGMTQNFHKEGLYSQEIFGLVGSDNRFKRYSWIDLRISVLHPEVFNCLVRLKSLYGDIMSGKAYARWDNDLKDYVRSNALEGQTGYQFFLENWSKIVFERNSSRMRSEVIDFVEKYKSKALIKRLFVLAAGYRDLETDEATGRVTSDDVNKLYKRCLAIANTIQPSTMEVSPQSYNAQRLSLQYAFNEIYEYVWNIMDGKNGLWMGKFVSRTVAYGTRNVITAMDMSNPILGSKSSLGIHHTAIGLYQYAKAYEPLAIYWLKEGYLNQAFTSQNAPALLCNAKTLRTERAMVSVKEFDRWTTRAGLSDLLNYYAESEVRNNPIMVDDYYLGLMYRGPDGTFKIIGGIDELPVGRSPEDCTPLTYTELLYCALYKSSGKYPLFVTRYPVATDRSTYPSLAYLFSTNEIEVRTELDRDWKKMDDAHIAYRFPVRNAATFGAMALHPARLTKLAADFDGDMCSGNGNMSEDSIKEVQDLMSRRDYYVGADGQPTINSNTDTVKYVLYNLTNKPKATIGA